MPGPVLTANGLTIQTADEIRADLASYLQAQFGISMQVLTGTSIAGQIVAALALVLSQNQEALDGVYQSGYLDGAQGVNLDRLVLLLGISRNAATKSIGPVIFTNAGAGVVNIPAGATYQNTATGDVFAVVDAVAVPGVGSAAGSLRAVATGPIVMPAGLTWAVVSAYAGSGDITCTNPVAGVAGTNEETDGNLRLRAVQSAHLPGKGTIDAIRAALLDLDGVTECSVFENVSTMMGILTPVSIPLLPAKSFTAVVKGGVAAEIGAVLWTQKPAGIETYGSLPVIVMDSMGFAQIVEYEPALPTQVWMDITLTGSNATFDSAIKAAVMAYVADTLSVGEQVVAVRAQAAIVGAAGDNVTGLSLLLDDVFPPVSSGNLAMLWNRYASLAAGDIQITHI